MQLLAQLNDHRNLIWKRTAADLRYRYAATSFGLLWSVLHPLALILTYSLVFSLVMDRGAVGGVPFPVFLCAGLLPWLGLTECVIKSCSVFRVNRAYLKRLPVPESVYVGQVALSATINMAISMVLLIVAALIVGVGPYWTWCLIPLPLMALMTIGFGVGLAVGTVNAFLPDIGEIVPVVMRIGMWAVPIILPFSVYENGGVGPVVAAMPPTPAIFAVRDLLAYDTVSGPWVWVGMAVWAVSACWLGAWVLHKLSPEIRDVL